MYATRLQGAQAYWHRFTLHPRVQCTIICF